MTKADLIQALESKFYSVWKVELVEQKGNINHYNASVYEQNEGQNSIDSFNIPFYVENEGEIDEKAFWHAAEPKSSVVPSSLESEVMQYINDNFLGGTIRTINSNLVLATIYEPDLTDTKKVNVKELAIYKEGEQLKVKNL